MATVLLILIYVIFIGLGLPDSVLGTAWPSMYPSLNLPLSYASIIAIIVSVCTTISSFFSARFINKIGTGIVSLISTGFTAVAIIGYACSNSMVALCLFAIPSGLGAGAIDSALNNYVAVHYKSSHLNFLHCFYGIGVALSPLTLSFALNNSDWRLGFRTVFYIQIAITVIAFIALPFWKRIKGRNPQEKSFKPITLSYKRMFKMPAVKIGWIVYFTTCALEFTCGQWCCTYLVNAKGISEALSARFLTLYYAGMALGRFISGLVSYKLNEKTIISIGYTGVGIALLTLFLPFPVWTKGVALFLIGLGNGPTYPNLTTVTPRTYGVQISQSLVSSNAVASNLGILIIPPLFGVVAQYISADVFPIYLTALFVLLAVSTVVYFNKIKNVKKYSIDNLNREKIYEKNCSV